MSLLNDLLQVLQLSFVGWAVVFPFVCIFLSWTRRLRWFWTGIAVSPVLFLAIFGLTEFLILNRAYRGYTGMEGLGIAMMAGAALGSVLLSATFYNATIFFRERLQPK